MLDLKKDIVERFIRYTKYDTMSDGNLAGVRRPTTPGQEVLLEKLKEELDELGLETYYGEEKVVMGTLKGNAEGKTIGFMAHVDTADDVMGDGVKAKLWEKYDGSDIQLDGVTLAVKDNPDLLKYVGSDIITSDGTTLLGSDDKAGVAIIMEAIKYLVDHPEVKHPDVEVYFTPDEETGSGMCKFPHERLKSFCCYTIDGGDESEIECECFNAATMKINLEGVSYHLGAARGRLVNAVTMASQIVSALPQAESPEATDGRYGYYCPLELSGTGTKATLTIFIRDFDLDSFNYRIESVKSIVNAISLLYKGKITVDTQISYHNMAEANKNNPEATEAIFASGKKLGLSFEEAIIRGGTDGARLAETGVACPNLFTGGHNLHSLTEWVSVESMNHSANLVLGIIDFWTGR